MGLQLERKKKRNLLLSVLYRIHKILPYSHERKLKLYLNLEWIFDRLAHETSFKVYSEKDHPIRKFSTQYILKNIKSEHIVLDLGCKYGELTYAISAKAKKVIGIDFDEKAIGLAKQKFQRENLTFIVDDAIQYIEKQEFKFDVLILSHILEHLDQPKEFLASYAKHFQQIYIEVPDFNKTYLNEYRAQLACDLIYTDPDHVSEFDRHELKELIDSCGLTITDSEYAFGIQKIWCKSNVV